MKPKIMLIGLGDLGGIILELLAREAFVGQILVASRNLERGVARCNLARLAAMAHGFNPDIKFVQLDLNNQEAVAETIQKAAPELILSTATMQTWWLPELLPPTQAALIKNAGFGVWLPVHLTLTMKFMQAIRAADYKGITFTAPFPDVANCILRRLDLTPTCGIGNVDEVVAKMRFLATERLNTSFESVQVYLVAHHALQSVVFKTAKEENPEKIPPFYLRIEHNGQDVTDSIKARELLLSPYPLTPGAAIHFLTAGSTVRLMRAFFSESRILLHTPAPEGLPGGYPVLVSREGVQPASIPGLTLNAAITINEQSHRFDGIERIEPDGTAVFCQDSIAILREALGYDCERLPPDESELRANELITRFKEYAHQYGVKF
ncbi:MAG: saccharopine dehydrogenase NADP-binding domain-containing protein [bacterium]